MPMRRKFRLVYAPRVRMHLKSIETKYHALIRDGIEEQLVHEPLTETRNRKPLRRPAKFDAEWELRLGPNNRFRVFYAVDRKEREASILAIGVKDRERLLIAGMEVTL